MGGGRVAPGCRVAFAHVVPRRARGPTWSGSGSGSLGIVLTRGRRRDRSYSEGLTVPTSEGFVIQPYVRYRPV